MNFQKIARDPSAIGLVLANLITIGLAVVFQWGAFEAMMLYWCQSIIVGFFAIFRMMVVPFGQSVKKDSMQNSLLRNILFFPFRLLMIGFFIFHFGMFNVVHLFFINIFGAGLWDVDYDISLALNGFFFDSAVLFAIASFFVVHFISLILHWGELKESDIGREMSRPYVRVIVMHFSIILGTFFMMALGNQVWLLVVFMLIKTVVDVGTHLAEHAKPKPGLFQ